MKKIIIYISRLRFLTGLFNTCFKPGHFYSPIVSLKEIKKQEKRVWAENSQKKLPGINLNPEKQTNLIQEFTKHYKVIPFSKSKDKTRYFYENIFFSYTDAIFSYSIIQHFRPKQIIEAGSGFSSALMLDTAEHFNHNIKFTFIEPYAKRLKSLVNVKENKKIKIIESKIQSLEPAYFDNLEENDILFIDSTHVSKTGSDVNYILFNILPRLKKGVLIHFHDIFYPFEYPKNWVYQGRSWNESYILRAFLMNNNNYEIILFADYLHKHHKDSFKDLPLCYKNTGGSIWLKKINDQTIATSYE